MRRLLGATWIFSLALTAAHAHSTAVSAVTASPASATPTAMVAISGTGFGASEAVDIYLDATDTVLAVASAKGSFSATITLSAAATPGKHFVTAVGRHSGDAAQTPLTVSTPWTEFGYGHAHLNWNPYENVIDTGNVSQIGELWGAPTATTFSTPMVVGGTVFTAGSGGITALSAKDGSALWNVDSSERFYGSPAVSGGMVYALALSGTLYAVDATTGATIWMISAGPASAGDYESAPVIANGTLYVGSANGNLLALDPQTGALRWSYTTGGDIESSPAVVDGIVYVGSSDTKLYALDAVAGTLVWSFATQDPIMGSPAVSNGVVYFGSEDHYAYALTAGTGGGALIWSVQTTSFIDASPAIIDHEVIVASGDGHIYALDQRTGATVWSILMKGGAGSAVAANGLIYIGTTDSGLLAVNATSGAILQSIRSPGGATGLGLCVSDGRLYFTSALSTSNIIEAYALQGGSGAVRPLRHAPPVSALHPDMTLRAKI